MLEKKALRVEEYARGFLTGGTLFEELGFYYVGPIDGHNLDHLLPVLKNVRDAKHGPILVHVVTQKGKGYAPAEDIRRQVSRRRQVRRRHRRAGEGEGERAGLHQGVRREPDQGSAQGRQDRRHHRRDAVRHRARSCSARNFPSRTFDVGIAEQHGVTFAAGLATEGYKPFAAIYSTFLQRAYDQVVHDVAIQRLPVRFAMDRAGLVGADGPTHAGSFDVAYLGCLPGFVLMAAADEAELVHMVATAVAIDDRPSRAALSARRRRRRRRCRRKACRSRSARAASCARAPRSRCSRSARGSANASRRPTSSARSGCRRRSPMRALPSRSIPIWCCGSRASTKC